MKWIMRTHTVRFIDFPDSVDRVFPLFYCLRDTLFTLFFKQIKRLDGIQLERTYSNISAETSNLRLSSCIL